jgi:hypothetical protein
VAGVLLGLEPDEHLVASTAASFRGAALASTQSTFALGSNRSRMRVYDSWQKHAEEAGLPTSGPEVVLGLTEHRLVVCRATFWLSRPAEVTAGVPLQRVANVATLRHGLVTGMAIALDSGAIIEFEAMRGRRLRRFAHELLETLAGQRR